MSGGVELGLSEDHQGSVGAFLRLTRYQRAQRLRSVDACFQDVKDTRLLEETYTSEEVGEVLDSLNEVVRAEVEGELIHSAHTHSLLLARLFAQAQKWHLTLVVDTSDLENQDLLEEIRKFEERESDPATAVAASSPARRPKLAPLTEAEGPLALLQAEVKRLTQDNSQLRSRLAEVQDKVEEAAGARSQAEKALQRAREELASLRLSVASRPSPSDVTELSDEVEKMRLQLFSEAEGREETELQLGKELVASRNSLLQVKAQLQLAEKELEKKFSQTGAYQNMKKMLNKKNEQLKALRSRLAAYEPSNDKLTED